MNQPTQNYKDLVVWQKGIDLAKMIYRLTATFPQEERFGLISQMRRAAVSFRQILRRNRREEQPQTLSNLFHMLKDPLLSSTPSLSWPLNFSFA